MDFVLNDPDRNPLVWLGVYDETYRRSDGEWRISRSTLNFLWPDRHTADGFPGAFPAPRP